MLNEKNIDDNLKFYILKEIIFIFVIMFIKTIKISNHSLMEFMSLFTSFKLL